MLRFAADENFNHRLLGALARQQPGVDILSAQDAGLAGADDATILAWAASEARVLLTHDFKTLLDTAYKRIANGERMPGVFAVHWLAAPDRVVEDLLVLAVASFEGEWEGQVVFVPL